MQTAASVMSHRMGDDNAQAATGPYPSRPHPNSYVAYRAEHPPSINGKLDDPCWKAAPWSEDFVDIEGPAKPTPRHQTRVKMLWDDDCLYIGAWMEEPQPWASLTLHDSIIYKDNDFEIFIDPDGDNHNYYEIEINALGTVWDLFLAKPYRDGGPVLHNWETLASSEPTQPDGPTGWRPMRRAVWVDGSLNDGSVTSRGWSVEVALPWSILGQAAMRACPPSPGDQWRINFSRVQWKVSWDPDLKQYVKDPIDQSENNWVWSPQWEVAMHKPEYWGYVQFSNALAPGAAAATTDSVSVDGHAQTAAGPAVDPFVPDASWPLRTFLMDGYNKQKAFYEQNGQYATSLEDLGLPHPCAHLIERPLVQSTEVSFIVSGQLPAASKDSGGAEPEHGQETRRYYVNEQGQISWKNVKC